MHNREQARLGSWERAGAKKARREPTPRPPLSQTASSEPAGGLREALRQWRAQKSKELGVPPYTIFWDRTLDELCQQRPASAAEMINVWGIGEAKQRKFGAELLALIAQDLL